MKLTGRPWPLAYYAAALCFAGALTAIAYIVHAVVDQAQRAASDPTAVTAPQPLTTAVPLGHAPSILFRGTALGDAYGRLALVRLDTPEEMPLVAELRCDRVHFAAGRGVCLTARRGVFTSYEAVVFDDHLQALYKLPLRGAPSRVRISPDGRFAATTVFVSGHSYSTAGFSTHTSIVALQTGEYVAPDLEKFTVWRGGERFQAPDFNYWGVTFSRDSHRFYATLGSGGRTYLIEGDVSAQEAWVRRDDIECPSLSPDNSRIAFKKRIGGTLGPVTWRLAVLDLATSQEWLLAETRSVDDQVEWLDDQVILYALPDRTSGTAAMHTWAVVVDGRGEPRRFLPHAYSPVVVRPWLPRSAWSQKG